MSVAIHTIAGPVFHELLRHRRGPMLNAWPPWVLRSESGVVSIMRDDLVRKVREARVVILQFSDSEYQRTCGTVCHISSIQGRNKVL